MRIIYKKLKKLRILTIKAYRCNKLKIKIALK